MYMNKMKLLFAMLMLVGFIACSDDEDPTPMTCETDALTYNNAIADILNTSCATSSCHDSNTTTTFSMANYTDALAAVGDGKIVGAINHESGFTQMPKDGTKLDDCTIDKLTSWINDGAPE